MADAAYATAASSVRECESHLRWIRHAHSELSHRFPLRPANLEALQDREVELLDQLIYRFTKMQDSIARRLLPATFSILEGSADPVPFLDILHRLEALGVVTSVDTWQFFRNLRNNLAHDYPESQEQTVATLNELSNRLPDFVELFETARRAIEPRLTKGGET